MSLPHMMLGWLMEGPIHGYLLKKGPLQKIFTEFGINDNQLYPTLRSLLDRGFIKKVPEERDRGPGRNIYAITDEGRTEFLAWLASSEGEERSFRYDFFRKDSFFIRCNFIRHLGRDEALAKVDAQAASVKETITDLKKAEGDMIRRGVDPLHVQILRYGIMSQKTRLKWLGEFREALASEKLPLGEDEYP